MKQHLFRALWCLVIVFAFSLQPTFSQSTSTFDVETTPDNHSVIQSLALPGNKVGVLRWVSESDVYLTVYDGGGNQTKHINITSQINWQHSYHSGVTLKAATTTDGKIFLAYAANTNSWGFETFNARYTLLNENGVAITSGQLNMTNATDYIFNIDVDRLSDGKLVTIWKRGNSTACFRIFNSEGTPFSTETAFAGLGTANSFDNIYQVRLAAGKEGNFMVSLDYWNGGMHGYVFTNDGANSLSGGAISFAIDPSLINDYANIGLAALSNGNFVQSWYLQGVNYMAIFNKDGSVIKSKYPSGLTNPRHFFPVYNPITAGYVQVEESYQDLYNRENPYSRLILHQFDNNGDLQTSSTLPEDYLIRPAYNFVQGSTSGFAYTYSYYRSYTIQSRPWDPPGMGMVMMEGDMDIKAATQRFATTSFSTLPVELVNFTATLLTDQQVQLEWTTASESENSHFEVQKSSDGNNFKTIGQVRAAGPDGHGESYQFTDPEKITARTYFRLRQFDKDGRSKMLGLRGVLPSGVKVQTSVYPNPVKGNSITITTSNVSLPIIWQLLDGNGRKVCEGILKQRSQQVSLSGIISGIYYLKVGKEEVIKLIK
jgi:hypothetical protein